MGSFKINQSSFQEFLPQFGVLDDELESTLKKDSFFSSFRHLKTKKEQS